jgi:hypothetical protein
MIPKIIHYCWLSGEEFPEDYKKCIDSWSILKDYEFILWDYERSKDIINESPFIKRCYDQKAYAFVSDYIRIYALYKYGGIYLDCDVEVIKPFDDILHLPYALCIENKELNHIETATMLFSPKNPFLYKLYNAYKEYDDVDYIDMIPIFLLNVLRNSDYELYYVDSPNDILELNDDNKKICLLPRYYFSPKSFATENIDITDKTYSIHYFNGGWKWHDNPQGDYITEYLGITINDDNTHKQPHRYNYDITNIILSGKNIIFEEI